MKFNDRIGRPLIMTAPQIESNEPEVAEHIVFATSPLEAKAIAEGLGLKFEDVQWYRSPDLLGDVDVTESTVHYSASFTHRSDYAKTRDRVKQKTGKGKRRTYGSK